MGKVTDKNGVPIQQYDVLKVYHFTGARRKKHFMYKHVIGNASFSDDYFCVSSLSECGHTYSIRKDKGLLIDIEIIQGTNLDKRKKE